MSLSVRFLRPPSLDTSSFTFYASSTSATTVMKIIVVRHVINGISFLQCIMREICCQQERSVF